MNDLSRDTSTTVRSYRLCGGHVLGPDGEVREQDLSLGGGTIAASISTGTELAVEGLLVLPGIVDLHGDAFERQMMPRPGVRFPLDLALLETDRQMIANGITTAYHGVTYSWEPGLRGAETVRAILRALADVRGGLVCDTRFHLRFETFNLEAVDEVRDWINARQIDVLAFNDHQDDIQKKRAKGGLAKYADRSGLSVADFETFLDRLEARRGEVPAAMAGLAAAARKNNVPILSHDDPDPATRDQYHAMGSRLAEFPMNMETARHAHARDDMVILGAPNVLRGGSHAGRLGAEDAIKAGLCDVLTSDYYYPSLLQAAFSLVSRGVLGLGAAWNLVSANPAKAVGLEDRGQLESGARADVLVVDARDQDRPQVVAAFVAGRMVYQTRDLSQN